MNNIYPEKTKGIKANARNINNSNFASPDIFVKIFCISFSENIPCGLILKITIAKKNTAT